MAYRNGTYVAFAADGNEDLTTSDIRFYNLMKGWKELDSNEFTFINSHEKGSALLRWSSAETIKRTLRSRLDSSTRFMLLVGDTTRFDNDFVPYEIEYAIDICKIPVIVSYVNIGVRILNISQSLRNLWPAALKNRIDSNTTKTIHIPFRKRIIIKALNQYNLNNFPPYAYSTYSSTFYNVIDPFGTM